MSLQHNETIDNKPVNSEKIKYAVVAVASGEGIKEYFTEIGCHRIIDGGQTQNPSAKDFLDAFSTINAEYIVVLPNNSNIILTASQAAQMYTDAEVRVIPTKSIPEGYSSLSMMNTWAEDIDSFIADMESPLETITSISITQAVSDACINEVDVKEGMFIGIAEKRILCSGRDRLQIALQSLESLSDIDEKEVITIFYGENVLSDECEAFIEAIQSKFPLIECGAIYGGQKIYDYYIAVE